MVRVAHFLLTHGVVTIVVDVLVYIYIVYMEQLLSLLVLASCW